MSLTRCLARRLAPLAATVVAGLLVAGCGSGSSTMLTLYNAQHEQTTNAIITAFTRATGIKVRVLNSDEDVLTAQLEQEGSRSPADLFYTENSNWLAQLDDRGMLAPVAPATLAAVPRRDSAANGDWVGVSARVSGLIYSTRALSPAQVPTSVLALAAPQWKGRIELAPAETDFWPIVISVARARGDAAALAWLKGLKANAASNDNVPDNETLTSDVSGGHAAIAIINHYYYYRYLAEQGKGAVHSRFALLAPGDPGYVEDVSGIGVLKSSRHPAEAQRFLAFITSAAGQEVLAHSASYEYPLHAGVAAAPGMPPLATLRPNAFTPAELGTGLQAEQLLREAGLI